MHRNIRNRSQCGDCKPLSMPNYHSMWHPSPPPLVNLSIPWRAVDQDGEVVDVYLQKRRDGAAAKRFFKRLLKKHQAEPEKIVTDKLRSYGVAHRELIPDTIHDTSQYANNRAELSYQPTRVRERGMRRFKSIIQTQRFLGVHSAVYTKSIWADI